MICFEVAIANNDRPEDKPIYLIVVFIRIISNYLLKKSTCFYPPSNYQVNSLWVEDKLGKKWTKNLQEG